MNFEVISLYRYRPIWKKAYRLLLALLNSEKYMIWPKDSFVNEEDLDDPDANKILLTEQFLTENEVILQICNTFDAFIQGTVNHFESKKVENPPSKFKITDQNC